MQYTTNKNFKLPDYTDVIDITDINDNINAIDEYIGNNDAAISQLSADIAEKAPANLVSIKYTAASDEEIDAAMLDAYSLAKDYSVKYCTLTVTSGSAKLSGGVWHVIIYRTDAEYGMIEAISYDSNSVRKAQRSLVGGLLSNILWENPVMSLLVEYHTTERFNGKPVYCVALEGTALEGENYAVLPNEITAGELVSVAGHVGDYPVPTSIGSNSIRFHNWVHGSVGFICDAQFVGLPYRFVVKYTKV